MTYNKKYSITRSSLKESLDYLEVFIEKMEMFQSKHPNYKYEIKINQNMKNWKVEIIIYGKQNNNKEIKEKSRACRVLQ